MLFNAHFLVAEKNHSERKTFQQSDEKNSRHCMKFSSKEGKSSKIEWHFFPDAIQLLVFQTQKYRVTELIKIVHWKQVINFDVQKSPR